MDKLTDMDENLSIKLTSYSYFLMLFLGIIWPLSIIIFFVPSLESAGNQAVNPILNFYLPTIAFQGLVLFLVHLIIRKENLRLSSIGFRGIKIYHIIYAVVFLILIALVLELVTKLLSYYEILPVNQAQALMPASLSDTIFWVILSLVVAVTEEAAYRGYLITRLNKLVKSKIIVVIISSLAFSAGHFYQGLGGVVLIFIYGILFSVLFIKTRSIWPCIIAHFIHNVIAPFI